MTWLYFLNLFILQWFFIRLVRIIYTNDISGETTNVKYKFAFGIYPLTGWRTPYKFINKKYNWFA
jgi:hypothetical protein